MPRNMITCQNVDCTEYMLLKASNSGSYCGKCGHERVGAPMCTCGESINVNRNFCEECGRPTR